MRTCFSIHSQRLAGLLLTLALGACSGNATPSDASADVPRQDTAAGDATRDSAGSLDAASDSGARPDAAADTGPAPDVATDTASAGDVADSATPADTGTSDSGRLCASTLGQVCDDDAGACAGGLGCVRGGRVNFCAPIRPMCGGFAGAVCTAAVPNCLHLVGTDYGVCVTDTERDCVCASAARSAIEEGPYGCLPPRGT